MMDVTRREVNEDLHRLSVGEGNREQEDVLPLSQSPAHKVRGHLSDYFICLTVSCKSPPFYVSAAYNISL